MQTIVVFGGGGHSKTLIHNLNLQKKWKIEYVVETTPKNSSFENIPTLSEEAFFTDHPSIHRGIIAIGDNFSRFKVAKLIKEKRPDFQFISLVHPSAIFPENIEIGEGSVLHAGVIIEPGTKIGQHAIINTGAHLNHDNNCGNFISMGPRSTTGGHVTIEDYSAIGLGASISHGITIGQHSVIGTGSAVVKNIPSHVVAVGVPCQVKKERAEGEAYL